MKLVGAILLAWLLFLAVGIVVLHPWSTSGTSDKAARQSAPGVQKATSDGSRAVSTATPFATRAAVPSPTATSAPIVRKVILVQGLDSSSRCEDNSAKQDTFIARRDKVEEILRPYLPGLEAGDIYGLSYAEPYDEGYAYCATRLGEKPIDGEVPIYTKPDTCGGIAKGSQALQWLINNILQREPGAEFDIIAHSMGGLVASYYVVQQSEDFLSRHIHSVVLLDSPVSPGLQMTNLESSLKTAIASACSSTDPSWRDMLPRSRVIGTIDDPSKTTSRVQFWSVLMTPIGQSLPGTNGNNVRYAQGYTTGSGGALFGGVEGGVIGCVFGPVGCFIGAFVGGFGGKYALDEMPGHSAVWNDPVTAEVIVAAVTGP